MQRESPETSTDTACGRHTVSVSWSSGFPCREGQASRAHEKGAALEVLLGGAAWGEGRGIGTGPTRAPGWDDDVRLVVEASMKKRTVDLWKRSTPRGAKTKAQGRGTLGGFLLQNFSSLALINCK